MRILLDNNLSPRLKASLTAAGMDVAHVRDLDLQAAVDPVVLDAARSSERTLVSADTDFGYLLARSAAVTPSVVLIRRNAGRTVEQLAALLVANLPALADDLDAGSVVVLTEDAVRVRRLPIS